jgi:hypothetical protein
VKRCAILSPLAMGAIGIYLWRPPLVARSGED